ncbi:MAG: O-antigen ligase protein [Polaromonas sp.]|nr:O-antigen ligase protein [Polaromonas sp.]
MSQVLSISILLGAAILAALAATIGMAGAVHHTSRRNQGYMHLIFYAMLFIVALPTLILGRDMATMALNLESTAAPVRHPIQALAQPLVSLFLLTVSGERIITYWLNRPNHGFNTALLALVMTFIIYWAGTVAATALFGAHPFISHEFAYPLVIGIAAMLLSTSERDLALKAARNALLIFMLGGLLFIPFDASRVLELGYSQGLLPGVPRFAGLGPHPVSMGMLAQVGLICLLAYPYERASVNRLAWLVGLSVLFMAQSKTAWTSFIVCSACIVIARQASSVIRRMGDPARPEFGIVSILGFMAVVLTLALLVMFGDLGGKLDSFLNSAQGEQLSSLTGRDQIWAIAYDEWRRNPVFGYGLNLWDAPFRLSIGMPNATHAHNQFMDTLSRSGTVGASVLMLYALVLLVLSIRYTRATGGLSLALFIALVLRSVSEVPLLLLGYGTELITHVLLLMTLGSAASEIKLSKGSTPAPSVSPTPAAAPKRPRPVRDRISHPLPHP